MTPPIRICAALLLGAVHGMIALAQTPPNTSDAQVRAEAEALRQRTTVMAEKVASLEAAIEERTLWNAVPKNRRKTVNVAALRDVKLPIGATKAQAEEYVKKIVEISRPQDSFSICDPQGVMLAKVGPENADILIAHFADSPGYMLTAISSVADASNKSQILTALAAQPELVTVVVEQGWIQDAKPMLCAKLKERPEYLPPAWIYAVAQLKDPDTYPDLLAYMVHGWNPLDTWATIRKLPGMDVAPAVADLWRRAESDSSLAPKIAWLALQYGHKDALERAVLALGVKPADPRWVLHARDVTLRHIPFRGTNSEILQWFNANKEKLVFDPKTAQYVLAEADAARGNP